MASLGCEVEQEIPTFEEVPHNVATADIGYIDLHPIADIHNIRRIATIFGDHAVNYKNPRAQAEKAACHRGTDKTHTTGNNHPRTRKYLKARIGTRTHHFSRPRAAEGCSANSFGPPNRCDLLSSASGTAAEGCCATAQGLD